MKKILNQVLREIKPKKKDEQRISKIANKVMKVSREIGKKYNFKPMLCGSVAKGTWLYPAELDLFLLFHETLPRKELENLGIKAGKEICKALGAKWEKKYTEHPYLRCFFEDVEMDIVPCYDIKPEKIKSAVDRTPWHVKYILKHLTEKQKDEVRLLKKFCKTQEVYGADLVHRGFSGYLCELLIIKFGSFKNAIREASKWYPPIVLYLGKKPSKKQLEEFGEQPFIFIDPVDPKRNVAAAVSIETFMKFIKACRDFLKKPSSDFFFPKVKELSVNKLRGILKKRDSRFYLLVFNKPDVHEDIAVSQLRRFSKILKKFLEKNGFSILATSTFLLNEICGILIESEIWKLPKIMKRVGPEVYSKHAKEFLKHYHTKRAWIEDGKWIVEDKRRFQTISEFLDDFFKGSEKKLLEKGIPSKLVKNVKTMKIYEGDANLIKFASKRKDFRVWLKKYFERNLNIEEK